MLAIGHYHTLIIDRDTDPGLFLRDTSDNEVLLPNKYKPEVFELEDQIEVFVYLDHEERPVATTLKPFIELYSFGYLRCTEVSNVGAFLDWGMEKELFVPFAQQARPMQAGHWYVVYMYLDEKTNRLAATSKTQKYLSNEGHSLKKYDKVDLMVTHITDRGINVIINGKHMGLIYKENVFEDLRTGDRLPGYIKKIRTDNKIDVILQEEGYKSIEPNAQYIYEELMANDGFLPLHDKSDPEQIQAELGLSKKSFKKAIGTLYKDRKIIISKEGIKIIE